MKKYLTLLIIALTVVSCNQSKKARISGVFAGMDQDTLYLEILTTKEKRIVDSTITSKKGEFRFNIKLPNATPTFYNIVSKNDLIQLIVSPDERLTVNSLGRISHNYTVEGSEDSKLLKEFNTLYSNGISNLDSIANLYSSISTEVDADTERQKLMLEYRKEYFKIKRAHITFVVTNANSMAAMYALYMRLPNDDALFSATDDIIYYRMISDSLSKKHPESGHVIALQKDLQDREKLYELNNLLQHSGAELNYPEIALPDMYNKIQKISDNDGKVILVDFWNMADAQSTISNAELKELYSEFAPKGFTIYQVNLGDQKANWVTAVQQQKLPWTSVWDSMGASGATAMTYNITAVPANILIDKEGNVLGRNIFGEELKTRIINATK